MKITDIVDELKKIYEKAQMEFVPKYGSYLVTCENNGKQFAEYIDYGPNFSKDDFNMLKVGLKLAEKRAK